MMDHLLALDLGSSALKAVLFDRQGGVAAQAEAGYATRATPDGGQEQDPADWWSATVAACGLLPAALRARLAAIVLVGTMENLVALDGRGEPVRPAMLYSDSRGASAFELARPALEAAGAGRLLGNAPDPLATCFKHAWLRHAEPAAAGRVRLILPGAKDYLAWRLTGVAATDPVTATTSGLMALADRDWAPALCRLLDIAPALLPPIRDPGTMLGPLQAGAAVSLGLPDASPVVNGCGDAGASTVGAESGMADTVHVYLGTSGWVARSRPLDLALLPRPFYTLAHPEAGRVIEVAPILAAGDAASWFGRIAGTEVALLDMQAGALDGAPPDALFLPYLKGERSPFVDLALRGAFIGLDAAHDRAALHYAVLEGVAFALRHNLDGLGGAQALRLTGGGGRSRIWPQLIADACGLPVEVLDVPAATTAFGGFRIAAAALGWPSATAPVGTRWTPRPERLARAERRFALFRAATASLRALATPPALPAVGPS